MLTGSGGQGVRGSLLLRHGVWDFRWEYKSLKGLVAVAGFMSRLAPASVWRVTLASDWGHCGAVRRNISPSFSMQAPCFLTA